MTKTLDEKIEQWFIDRNLQEANPVQQFHKLIEEMGELSAAITRQKSDDIKDAIGDIQLKSNQDSMTSISRGGMI